MSGCASTCTLFAWLKILARAFRFWVNKANPRIWESFWTQTHAYTWACMSLGLNKDDEDAFKTCITLLIVFLFAHSHNDNLSKNVKLHYFWHSCHCFTAIHLIGNLICTCHPDDFFCCHSWKLYLFQWSNGMDRAMRDAWKLTFYMFATQTHEQHLSQWNQGICSHFTFHKPWN